MPSAHGILVKDEALRVSTCSYILTLCLVALNQWALKNSPKKCYCLFIARSRMSKIWPKRCNSFSKKCMCFFDKYLFLSRLL